MEDAQTPRMVNLSGALTIDRAAALKSDLEAALAASDQVLVSLSLVEDIDLACLQVFYAARKSTRESGKRIHFLGSVPSRVAKRLAACGFLRGSPERAEEFEAALVNF